MNKGNNVKKSSSFLQRLNPTRRRKSYTLSVDDEDIVEIKNIGSPTMFQHHLHIGYDSETGKFVGLPDAWNLWLNTSNISETEQHSNPTAVLNALETFDLKIRSFATPKYIPGGTISKAHSKLVISEGSTSSEASGGSVDSESQPPRVTVNGSANTDYNSQGGTDKSTLHLQEKTTSKGKSPRQADESKDDNRVDKLSKDLTDTNLRPKNDETSKGNEVAVGRSATLRSKQDKKETDVSNLSDDQLKAHIEKLVTKEDPKKKKVPTATLR